MDNLPAHKLASLVPMIEAYGASVICLSPYSRRKDSGQGVLTKMIQEGDY
jgi:hypothetical protein